MQVISNPVLPSRPGPRTAKPQAPSGPNSIRASTSGIFPSPVVRVRACVQLQQLLASLDVALTDEQIVRVIAVVREVKRTKKIIAALAQEQIYLDGSTVRAFARVAEVVLDEKEPLPPGRERRPGAGRPKGSADIRTRKPREDRPSKQADCVRLRAEHPDWTLEEIGNALDITRSAVYQHLNPVTKKTASDGK